MSCDAYRQHHFGEMADADFHKHVQTCPACQAIVQHDRLLMATASQLDEKIDAPLLWAKIENRLRAEQQRTARRADVSNFFRRHQHALLRIAALLVVTVAAAGSLFLLEKTPASEQRILTASALDKIEKKEREYENAINELEKLVAPKFTKMDVDLMLLYRDRLETIDAQIVRCKEALAANPGNAHIRRYLLAALQDKRETLQEVNAHRSALN